MEEKNSRRYYDKLQATYASLCDGKQNYLRAVNSYIVNDIKSSYDRPISWIDIGCGDGKRTRTIYEALEKVNIVDCVEESSVMAIAAKSNLMGIYRNIINKPTEYASLQKGEYDVATCLWNVIGHAQDKYAFIDSIYECLKNNGVLFMDANNRFNVAEYGLFSVFRNIILSFLGISNGTFKLENNGVSTEVYIFEEQELRKILANAGFNQIETAYFNYRTGLKTNWLQGQIMIKAYRSY